MLVRIISHTLSKMDFSTISFILTTCIAGFIAFNASVQPRAASKPRHNKFEDVDTESLPGSEKRLSSPTPPKRDTISKLYFPQYCNFLGYVALFGSVYFLTILPRFLPGRDPSFATLSDFTCPHRNNLSPAAFTWNLGTASNLMAVIIGGCLRLEAFAQLGQSFSYTLRRPNKLVTSGLYQYMQHPGTTGLVLCWFGMARILFRMDALPACFLSRGSMWLDTCMKHLPSALHFVASLWVMGIRTCEEERVLRDGFGEQWKRWHRVTKRFVPGLF